MIRKISLHIQQLYFYMKLGKKTSMFNNMIFILYKYLYFIFILYIYIISFKLYKYILYKYNFYINISTEN